MTMIRKLSTKQENERLKDLLEVERDIRMKAERREHEFELSAERLLELLKFIESEDKVNLMAFKITHPKLHEAAIHVLTISGFKKTGKAEHNWYVKYPEGMKAYNGNTENLDVVIKDSKVTISAQEHLVRIKRVESHGITFEDGAYITYDHKANCCENNYADFEQLDDIAKNTEFDTKNMFFESVEGSGFRFGNVNKMFFIPCYSEQNGCYSAEIEIYYNNKKVLEFSCEEIINE